MNRRSETVGIVAVLLFVVALLAWQYWPTGSVDHTSTTAFQHTSISTTETIQGDGSGVEGAGVEDAGHTQAAPDPADPADTVIVYDRTIHVDDLPTEAFDTLVLIDSGGPYPYQKDGSTFQNREGYLPERQRGYYREFTVETPGSPDRGARRIVAGGAGELFWTDDHYDSFSQIVGW